MTDWPKQLSRLLLAAVLATVARPTTVLAQTVMPDLARVSIEDLMNIEVTGVSHKEQRTGDVAAAVAVITQEDIRRSGMTTLPELLRLVPGVQVARINSNKWAVTVRGFNNLFADKLLVLIDGRIVYDRLFSGVFWESLDLPLDLIERIEVVRGPGGATWGANAVNGVINIVTRSAADTPGAAVSAGVGTFAGTHAAARYGGARGRLAYRVYSKWSSHGQSLIDANTPANDSWQSQHHGFRLDWKNDRNGFMAEGGATIGQLRGLWPAPSGPVPALKQAWDGWSHTREYSVLGRWTRRRDNGAAFQVQSSIDSRYNNLVGNRARQTLAAVDAQYHTTLGGRHDVVVGLGYRFVEENLEDGFAFSIVPNQVAETVANVFAQDEIALGRRVRLTLGTKVEHDGHVGWGVQPTARVMWTPLPQQRLWAAISRAVRTPSLSEVTGLHHFTSFIGQGGLPVVVGALGNPAFQSEETLSSEAGYRREIGSVASVDVAVFVAQYDRLKTNEPLAPRLELLPAPAHLFIPVHFANLLEATAYGVELGVHWTPTKWWRVDGGYSTFHLTPRLSAASGDTAAASFDGNAPHAQWQARSAFSFRGVELDAMLFHSGALPPLLIPAYTRADARLAVPLTRSLSLSVVGQNLFDPTHREFAGRVVASTLVPRSASISLVWSPRP